MNLLTLIETAERRRRQIRINEPWAKLLQVTDGQGQTRQRVLRSDSISFEQLEGLLADAGEQLAACDADLKRYTQAQAAALRPADRQAWAELIRLTLIVRMACFREQARLQQLVDAVERLVQDPSWDEQAVTV